MKHIILIFIFIFSVSALAAETFYAESGTFSISAQSTATYSAESETFAINFDSVKIFVAESATFLLTGIDEIPEPFMLVTFFVAGLAEAGRYLFCSWPRRGRQIHLENVLQPKISYIPKGR